MTRLAVAALSARLLAEAARDDGFEVIALDLFGDADTRRAAGRWHDIGDPGSGLRIDPPAMLAALDGARRAGATGWIAGSGFEAQPDLLAQAASVLPLIGTPAEAVRRLRDPRDFAGALGRLGIAHPETRFTPPDDPCGWLVKEAGGTGGRHVTAAEGAAPGPAVYYQRRTAGRPMSALFVANRVRAHVFGWQRQRVQAIGAHPYVYAGAVGPLDLPPSVTQPLADALDRLVRHYGLAGLGSMDFLLSDGDDAGAGWSVLEINPRPPATMALYGPGLMRAHVEACRSGRLPEAGAAAPPAPALRGLATVYTGRAFTLTSDAADWLAGAARTHDLPLAGTRFSPGDPVCSVSAHGPDEASVEAVLANRIRTTLFRLEPP